MRDALNTFPTVGAQTLRALARYPDRTAFQWPGGSLRYRGATDLIGRIQAIFMRLGLQPDTRVALLTANRAETWCAGVAAQLSRFAVSWLHPLGSLPDQIDQIEDSGAQILVIDADSFLARGGELTSRAKGLRHVFTLGRADYGVDLLTAVEAAGTATAATGIVAGWARNAPQPNNSARMSKNVRTTVMAASCQHPPPRTLTRR